MGLLGAIGFSLVLVSLTQIHHCSAGACKILSAKSTAASSIFVKWERYPGATTYMLDTRRKNSTDTAPIVLVSGAQVTERNIQGLSPGTEYNVTLKVINFLSVSCVASALALTVPDTSQILDGWPQSSTSVTVKWTTVPSAQHYILQVFSQATEKMLNFTYTTTTATVTNLQPTTNYDCYVYTANQAGLGSRSNVRTITTLVQPPVGVSTTQISVESVRVTWTPVVNVLMYQVTIRNLDEPTMKPSVYNVTNTNLDINGIRPCSNYLISVSSFNKFLVLSEPTNHNFSTNKLAPVSSVSVDYSCSTTSAKASWSSVFGATSYIATAVDENGSEMQCMSQSTSCTIVGLTCGQQYEVHVIPVSNNCKNRVNATSASFQTAPCPPGNPMLLRECSSNVIIFSWNHTSNIDFYMARAEDSKGEILNCLTEDNSCYFTQTSCGRRYRFTVFSVTAGCSSGISSTVEVQTAPCIPQNLQTSASCGSKVLVSKWDHAEGALRYIVEAQGNIRNSSYNCSSQSNSCAMEDVLCGDQMTMTITAYDDECASAPSLGFPAETVPCVPQNVLATKECGSNSIRVSWKMNSGTAFYIAIAKSSDNVIGSCSSITPSCTILGLKCSTNYTVYVISSNFICNSSESEMVTLQTAACAPDNVTTALDCASNTALISWRWSSPINSFTATVTDEAYGSLSCSSNTTSCQVPNMICGRLYSVSVFHSDATSCYSVPSQPVYMESVPCGPSNVQVNVNCGSGAVNISWDAQRKAEGYIAVISDTNKTTTRYNTTQPRLLIGSQDCGQQYTVEVMSFNQSCVSFSSQTHFKEAPCVPTNVVASRSCGQKFVDVAWQSSRGAQNYTVTAVDGQGSRLTCVSTETSCRLDGVKCSQVYNVSVVAMDDLCSSMRSTPVKLTTEPCPPSQLTASINCSDNSAKLSWGSSPNAASYTGKASSSDGHTMTCDPGLTLGCQLKGLQCGKQYSFTVSASDGDCRTADSQPVNHTTAPCAVQGVITQLNCSTNALSISWTPGSLPVNYSTSAVSDSGSALSCFTDDYRCTLAGLQCGQRYTVSVKPISSTCEGRSSVPQIVNAVPCVPVNVQGNVECSTNTLQASWAAAAGATNYVSTLTGPGGASTSCLTANQTCTFTRLQCAQTYNFSVVAVNDRCNSTKSSTVSAKTAPCDPANVAASLNCLSEVATVTWSASAGANLYMVVAQAGGLVDSCNSTGTSCELRELQCGENYTVTVLAGDAKCNSSILAKTSIVTASCTPVIKNYSHYCVTNHTLVSWVEDKDAVSVAVNATSDRGHSLTCSSSTNSSCILGNLLCGHTYTVQAVAIGVQCTSKPSSAFQIITAPCTPGNVEYQYYCGSGIALVSWDEALGRDSYYVRAHAGDHSVSCSASQDTDCSLPPLRCSRNYQVEVISMASSCNSSIPGVTHIQTAPCAPTNLNASLLCENNTAEVRWQPSDGAVLYSVTATGRDGDLKRCTTNTSTCLLPNMHCSQTYMIIVSPSSNQCKGQDTQVYTYNAGSCPPTNIRASLQCAGNVGHVTWDAALRAEKYYVTTVPSVLDRHVHSCSTDGTNCSLTDLHCGETVAITVATIERGCRSEPSDPLMFKTVICPPSAVAAVTTCSSSDITVSWALSPETGAQYFIYAQKDGGSAANYSSSQPFRVISGLRCGEMYRFKVAAVNSECSSIFSEQIEAETAPCPPTNLTVETECSTNLATLSWAPSRYAVSYTATYTGTHGHVVSCSTNTTSCSVKVDCGHQYSAVVVASTVTCNSSQSTALTFDSAPCLPDQVEAELDCTANSFSVQWRGTLGDVDMYTAIAIGSDNTRASCDSASTQCTIQSLKCGVLYSIAVTTASIDCGTIDGSDYQIYSAPCKPDNVSVNLDCSTAVAMVAWENTGPDQRQVVTAVDSRGQTSFCNSSSSNCTFHQLQCGNKYTIDVVGYTNSCSSEPAAAKELSTAPCIPTHVKASVDCESGITAVTWDEALGATSYVVYAWGSLGHEAQCKSENINCNFVNLECGQDYNVTVVAQHDTCVSAPSEAITLSSRPCPHSALHTSLDCNTNAVSVSWTPGNGILHYVASADPFNMAEEKSCSTNGSSCNITSLRCGESYRVSVSGQGQTCPSPSQYWNTINTAPCPPTNLVVSSSCTSNNISVSWQDSQGSTSYMAVAENENGRQWSCNTSSSTCQIPELLCGQKYDVYVVGIDSTCFGAKSEIKTIRTAPCVPENIQTHLDCPSGLLNVTWESTGYFIRFQASVASGEGHVNICTTGNNYCLVQNMECGTTYDVTVTAQDEACNSSHSPAKQVKTAPCPPSSFHPRVDCSSGVVSVTWNSSVSGVVYTVSAVDEEGRAHNCSGTNSGCNIHTLQCGTEYNVSITPSRDACVGQDSATALISTVPCVPQLSDVEIDCLTNSAWVMFDESDGAEGYVIVTTNSQGAIQTFECNATSDGMCALPTLACSQNLTFTLKAQNEECISAASNAVTTETAPCPPQGITETVNCDDGTLSISWSAVPGAVTYTATLEELNGGTPSCCTSSSAGCDIGDLPCGEMYILHVTAEGRTCNSSESDGIVTRTVACVPENLKANLICSSNVASMSWSYSRGGQLYTVRAVGAGGHLSECRSPDNQCDLTDLQCGELYNATVTGEDVRCRSKPSDSVTIKTVPCTPENTSTVMDCEANSLIVSWSESAGADSYIATLQDSYGRSTTCQGTTEGSCGVSGVGCGQIYHVSVVSSDGYCNSPPTDVLDTPSVPCKPRNIRAAMDCYTKTAQVSWYPSDGALSYLVVASTASGHSVTCETNTTSCELEGLQCGQSYSVWVKSEGESCSSSANMTGELLTEPCIPEQIAGLYNLAIGQVEWDKAAGADNYTVTAETDQGLTATCTTRDNFCTLYNMECGQVYNISVTSHSDVCKDVSVSTEHVTIVTEPCPPKNLETNVNCQEELGTVSWESSWGSVGYEVQLAGRDGHSLTCVTNTTFCNVRDLHCGVVYYTNVIAIGENRNSSKSTTVLLTAAPCTAGDVAASYDCYNNSAEVSWSYSVGASSYRVTAVSPAGHRTSCETDELQCELLELECSQTYSVTFTTISDQCQIETYTNVSFSTRPCKPQRVGVDLRCGTSTADMFWDEDDYVEVFMATATNSVGMTLQCNSTNSTCQFPDLDCGEKYVFSVTAYSSMCYSEEGNSVEIQTDPCQPAGLVVSGSCHDEMVTVSWDEAPGAAVYVVTAAGHLGYVSTFQANETWIETDLPCGQMFTFTVTAQDDRCESAVSQPEKYKTGPCTPEALQTYTRCEDSLGSVSWTMFADAESYLAVAVGQDGHIHQCASNTTSCTWDDLHCGEIYTVNVVALDYRCTSMQSNSTIIRMAPCIPQDLKSSINCSTKVGSLTWNASETAEFYIVTAETNSGHKVQLSTNDTWTFISEFLCGQEYFLSVQAADAFCTSRPSQPSKLFSEPCPPTEVHSVLNCLSNIALLSWTGSAGAEFYTATVMPEDGQPMSCASENEQCAIPNILCGKHNLVTVVGSNGICDSDPSMSDILQSVPCVPTDVRVTVNCSTNEAVVSWSASDGALFYKVIAVSTQGAESSCATEETRCALTNLTCGHQYNVQVVAQDNICSSLPSPAVAFESVPCTPNIGSVILDCYTNSALLDWMYSEGALNYTSTARSSGGHVSSCTTSLTNCELESLQCGQTYEVATVASNDQCSSPPSATLQLESVPCPPEDVVTSLDCDSNVAQVEWQASSGADSYIVQAFGVQEHETNCSTDSPSCILPDLMCGFTYNVSVIAVNAVCNVSQSEVQQLKAVPCVPALVEARVVCESGGVMVSWEQSRGASSYSTMAHGGNGFVPTCNSSSTSCLLDDVLCGQNYSITVIASDDVCSSAESSAVEIDTAPCVPQEVTAEMLCGNNTGVVSWAEDEGVDSYHVQALGPDGHKIFCDSDENSCELPSMHCGQTYNLTVTAQDGRCDNSNAYLDLKSVPCKPTNVGASLRCHSNSAAVTWEGASGALSYVAVGVTADGTHRAECNNTMTFCDLRHLRCGQTYSVSVFGLDESCAGEESSKTHLRTAPCPPQNVTVAAKCAEKAMVVSWAPSLDAQYLHVSAVSSTGARLYCNSSSDSCTIAGLPCGQRYDVTVISVRDACESKPSAVVATSSAPCVPTKPNGHLDCVSNSAWVSWTPSEGASSYSVLATAAGGHNSSCIASSSPCEVADLKCGTLYTLHVTAVNKHCRSNHSSTFEIETGPCALESVSATAACNSDTILVEWKQTLDSPLYLVTGEADDKSVISCNSSSNWCVLHDARCGRHYSVIVSASSDKCSSLRSPPTKIKTAPCVPSNVTVVPRCEDRGAVVSWEKSLVATSFRLTARGQDGHVVACNNTANNCSLSALHCGQTYGVSITAVGENCTSYPSNNTFRTVPCAPSNLAVDIDCQTNYARLSWARTDGAVEYFSRASSAAGEAFYCDSSNTSCTLKTLQCGNNYNFTVKAFDGACNSSESKPLQEGAAPCPPSRLNVRMQRIKLRFWAMLSWDKVNCSGVEYLAEVRGWVGNDPLALMKVSSYWQPRPYFELPMPCSSAFNVTVFSRNSGGVSKPSRTYAGTTEPCAPQRVKYSGNSTSAILSWDASVLATMYTVYNVSGGSRVKLCSTTGLSCQLVNFNPAATAVTASNAAGESNPSQNITGPVRARRRRDLQPDQLDGDEEENLETPEVLAVTASAGSLDVKWKMVDGATKYELVIEEEQNAEQRVRNVDGDFYTETGLKPMTSYCVRVAAKDGLNRSNFSWPTCRKTGAS
ncbi:uncharacterized protein fndc7b [Poecilia latipinna]|uniref:uncharacterized protein fndc7b n=1 Tax=Poecilia latipinna TaxID=48699 RepID=UPI00072EAF79|nr:PREDICTED: uncharacterized protein LOC106955916 [Poecilia latipinna]